MKYFILIISLFYSLSLISQDFSLVGEWEGIAMDKIKSKKLQHWTFLENQIEILYYNEETNKYKEWRTFDYRIERNHLVLINDESELFFEIISLNDNHLGLYANELDLEVRLQNTNTNDSTNHFQNLLCYKIKTDHRDLQNSNIIISREEVFNEGKASIILIKQNRYTKSYYYCDTLPDMNHHFYPASRSISHSEETLHFYLLDNSSQMIGFANDDFILLEIEKETIHDQDKKLYEFDFSFNKADSSHQITGVINTLKSIQLGIDRIKFNQDKTGFYIVDDLRRNFNWTLYQDFLLIKMEMGNYLVAKVIHKTDRKIILEFLPYFR